MPGTVRFHRVLSAPPEKVYRAFVEPDALAKWLPPDGFLCTVHSFEPSVGGQFRMSFRNFTTGGSHSFGGTFEDMRPGERLVYTDRFDDPSMPDEMRVTVSFRAVSVGTEMEVVQENIPDQIPPEACVLGWQDSLENLAKVVEPVIEM
ncbi:MAG: SRPBCC family protein [Armatimonadetes bacterium]|nr:SRPBCC family protein [Armatimonadota bacterium]